MKLNSQDLKKIAELTLDCYNQNAEDFWEGTRNHDVSQNIAALLQHIESERPFTILDFGSLGWQAYGVGKDQRTDQSWHVASRGKGVKIGRPKLATELRDEITRLAEKGQTAYAIAKALRIDRDNTHAGYSRTAPRSCWQLSFG